MTVPSRFPRLIALALAGAAFAAPRAAAQTIVSGANQTFVVGDASTTISAITITDRNFSPTITATNNIRIRIPAGLNMTWDATVTTATITGGAAGKVSTTVSYANGNLDLVINVTTSFSSNDQIVVSGLKFTNFTAASAASNLGLITAGFGGAVVATDTRTKMIIAPTFTETASQVFAVGNPSTAMSTITVTDAATAATITAANDLRIRIPTGFNMTWNTALTTATIGGAAAAKVSTTVSYENAGQVLVLNVTSNFVAGDQITVAGLQFSSFTAVSAAAGLQLVISGAGGGTAATSNRTKQIIQPTISSAAAQTFTVGAAAVAMSTITVTDNATSPTITAANDIRIRIPASLNMIWNTVLTTATIGGASVARLSTTVSYEDGGKTLVLNVTSNFVAGSNITVSGLQFMTFTAPSAATNLQLVISGAGGTTTNTDNLTKTIVAPTVTEAANQTFVVGDPATTMTSITITDAATATITAANDIRIRIPAGFNMTWNTGITTATITGFSAAKVSTTVTYENAGQVLVLNVTSNFAAGNVITVAGLQFTNFTAVSAADNLQLVVSGSAGGGTAALSTTTKQIVAPTLVGAANQTFVVGDPATAMTSVTITDATTATITAANDIRLRVPAGFNMTWNTALTTATIGGAAAAKVSTAVTYENAGQVLVLNVTSNFAAGDVITVAGLQFTGFTAVSAANNLQLVVSGSAGGNTAALSTTIKQIVAPALTGAANQFFAVGDPPTAMTTNTVTDNATTPTITAANDIRIRIPAGFNMTWNTGLTTATIGGAAAAKVSTTVSYENAGQVLVLNVTANFAAGDQITVAGTQFSNFTAVSAAANLQLVVSGSAGGGTAALSATTKQIVQPTISSVVNQGFAVAQLPAAMSPITVTDNATAATITAANDLRIRIPASINMTWNTALTTATIGGGSAAKVSTTVSYEDAGKTLVLNVTADFAVGNQITVSGLQFDNFTAASAATNLQLVVSGTGGGTAATDNRTVVIGPPLITSAANQTFVVGQPATAISTITVTDNATAPTITAANDIRIRIPAGFNMTWNTGLTTATIAGGAAAKVSTAVSYENGGHILVLNVTANFAAGDQITVSGLQFATFTAPSAADSLELDVSGSGAGTAATDTRTIAIVAPTLSSTANQNFAVGDPATAMATATVSDNAIAATITAVNDIRIRIPAGFNMTWNTGLTTATIGGGAAAKVSTTVSYENAGQVLVVNVTANFAAGDQITVAGLQFTNFTAASAANNLQLVVSGAGGGTAASDDKTMTITTVSVSVNPHSTTADQLPSNGTNYTVAFVVQNMGSLTDSYDLLTTRQPGTVLTTVSITGAGITQGGNLDSAHLSTLSAGGSVTATVTYSVGGVVAGALDTLSLLARSVASSSHTDRGRLIVTVVRPNLTLSKGVSPSGTQPPGTDLTYTVTFTNGGTSDAASIVLVDTLPPTLQLQVGSVSTTLPAGVAVVVEYSNNGGATWTYVPASGACGAPSSYDRCVNRVRWSLQVPLSSFTPDNVGTLQLIAQIR